MNNEVDNSFDILFEMLQIQQIHKESQFSQNNMPCFQNPFFC